MLYDNLGINDQGHLTFGNMDTVTLAQQYGTPLLLMDEQRVRNRCREYIQAMADHLPAGSKPLYASKALSFKGMYRIMEQEGMGVDVVSPGELYTAVAAGYSMKNAYFHGNSKTDGDIRFAISHGIGCIVSEVAEEIDAIDREAARQGVCQNVMLRLCPGIDPHTHVKINTGSIDCKFGVVIENGQAMELVRYALGKKNICLVGYHCHVGSQLFDTQTYCDAAAVMLQFVAQAKKELDYEPSILNLGGGMAVPYIASDAKMNYTEFIRQVGEMITKTCRQLALTPPAILMEPGRSIVGDSGITLYEVTGLKQITDYKNYVSVDGGMSDNPRYTLYESDYTVLCASHMNAPADFVCTIAGRCCESGDLIQENVTIAQPQRGDILAVLTTGAYNYSMASNYNRIPRPPVVMVNNGQSYEAVRRETYEDLTQYDM